ncbi:N-acetylmuramoyl-L-alanine amidase [Streptomyces sp. NPDC047017]|uniref:N-acetylmuramoyl-L-alanine amidase n=1 Tax=Streptomyces sp. NPDC047017 TaxID=3155024 RepID=UPI00340A2A70
MSYVGPEFDPSPSEGAGRPGGAGRRRRGPVVALGALAAAALLGWLAYEAVGSPGGPGGPDGAGGGPGPGGTAATSGKPPSGSSPASPASPSFPGDDAKQPGGAAGPLRGKVVVIDPGHNPGNVRHTAEIDRQVDIGTGHKECDTTGTATNAGYAEARFTLDVAHRLRALLEQRGVTVKLTHDGDSPAWGPCVDERARIGNAAHADAALSLHADGAAAGDRGFHVILPAAVREGAADTRPIAAASHDLGVRLAGAFLRATGEPPADYVGGGTGLVTRKDLGGLNLSTVPKVFIECGNMRNSTDAARLTSADWRQQAAQGMSEGIVSFLSGS